MVSAVLCVALSRLDVCLLCASLSVTVLDVRGGIPTMVFAARKGLARCVISLYPSQRSFSWKERALGAWRGCDDRPRLRHACI